MEHSNCLKACDASVPNPNENLERSIPPGPGHSFSIDALAPCLADLKRQLELRQAMH
jgi:hypothetical protein